MQGGNRSLRELEDRLLTLGDDTKAVSLAISARSALRAIPLLEHLSWDKQPSPKSARRGARSLKSNPDIVLGTFRSAATAWVAASFAAFGRSERFDAIKGEARMAGGAADAGNSPAASAGFATHQAMATAETVYSQRPSFNDARETCARIAARTVAATALGFLAYDPPALAQFAEPRGPNRIAERELSPPERAVYAAALDDLTHWMGAGRDIRAMLVEPLWIASMPPYAQNDWQQLAARLRARAEERWQVWVDWYEAHLAGPTRLSEEDEIARVSLPNEAWEKGAAAANADL
jgi:hypothetical protein